MWACIEVASSRWTDGHVQSLNITMIINASDQLIVCDGLQATDEQYEAALPSLDTCNQYTITYLLTFNPHGSPVFSMFKRLQSLLDVIDDVSNMVL